MGEIYNCVWVKPRKKPEEHRYQVSLKNLDRDLGSQPDFLPIVLRSGKKISVVLGSDALADGKEYNFTICVVPEDKKTYIDIFGDALVFGRSEDEEFLDCELTEEEKKELFSYPYGLSK